MAAAACFLPLTVNPRLSKDLGTRHRAAIGLTEENDARRRRGVRGDWLDLGRARGAHRAQPHAGAAASSVTPAAASAACAASRRRPQPRAPDMRPRILRNFGRPRCCPSALAALLWGMVAGQREAERSLRVPLEYPQHPDRAGAAGRARRRWSTCASGAAAACSASCDGADLVAVLDLRTARPGRRLFHLLPDDIAVPAGVKVLQATPSTLSLTFEALCRANGARGARRRRGARAGLCGGPGHDRCPPRSRSSAPSRPWRRSPKRRPSRWTSPGLPVRSAITGDHRAARHARPPAQSTDRRGDDRGRPGAGRAHPRTRGRWDCDRAGRLAVEATLTPSTVSAVVRGPGTAVSALTR